MKDTDRSEPKRSDVVVPQVFVVIGCRWFLLVAMTTGFPLITQRSLVQIQPPIESAKRSGLYVAPQMIAPKRTGVSGCGAMLVPYADEFPALSGRALMRKPRYLRQVVRSDASWYSSEA